MRTKDKVTLTINNLQITVPADTTVLQAAREAGFDIPTLCYLKDINEVGACRICVVEVETAVRTSPNLSASCILKVQEGMNIRTNSKRVRKAVQMNLELILANHNRECLSCIRNGTCELQKLCDERGIDDVRFKGATRNPLIDDLSYSIVRDSGKCILCGRCISTCQNVQGIGVLDFYQRGFDTQVGPAFEYSMRDVNCIYCGQCIEACPVGALHEKSYVDQVWDAIENPEKIVVVQTAPAVRASLGEEFGLPIGTPVTGKMVTALRRLGFDRVFDTNFSADLTIMEEATELLQRLENGVLPMITSCSPGWVRFCEMYYPDLLDHLSTCKSPQQMMGAMIKSYYAKKEGIDPKNIVSVSVMPCTSKKTEAMREEMEVDGLRDVDISLTTRELGAMIKQAGILFHRLDDEDPDSILGDYSGAGVIFGTSGGVMEAALRTAADVLTGEDLKEFTYIDVRGMQGIKEASFTLPFQGKPTELKVAVASSLRHATTLLEKIREKKADYHFIEIMACPGGCIHGGGQSYVSSKDRMKEDPRGARMKALYSEDERLLIRKSHHNPEVIRLYKDFLKKPNGPISHKYLHTHYTKREFYPQE